MSEEKVRMASCACGQLKIETAGEPSMVSSCACQQCQRRTGALFGVTAFFSDDQVVSMTGESGRYERIAESGYRLEFQFCPTCASTVYWRAERRPGRVCIAGGAFADPLFPSPQRMVWSRFRHPFVILPEGLPEHPENP